MSPSKQHIPKFEGTDLYTMLAVENQTLMKICFPSDPLVTSAWVGCFFTAFPEC